MSPIPIGPMPVPGYWWNAPTVVNQYYDEEAYHHWNSEKRKEKSRDAARCRRSRETEIFTSLARELPLPESVISTLDKASIMRIAISYLKLHDLASIYSVPKPVSCPNKLYDSLFLQALDGFVLIASAEGDLVYLSENVHGYLGITQVDLMGNSIYEFSHPCDHDEIREVLAVKASPDSGSGYRSFFLRLKCTLTPKGRNVNLKSASYKVMHCSGQMVTRNSLTRKERNGKMDSDKENDEDGDENTQYLVAVAEPIPHPSNIEIPLDKQTFLSKHSLDMKFTYADEKMAEFLGYSPEDLIGKSLYEFQYALDTPAVDKPFKTLFAKGQCETGRYRFLAKGGGYAWVLTQATIIYGSKGQKPNSVVCVNFIISGIENKDEVYASSQLLGQKLSRPVSVTCSVISRLPTDVKTEAALDVPAPAPAPPNIPLRPQATTAKIFGPRTEDMNKGFLMFSDEEGLTMLKDEPEDLTHLAPTAGDVCVPLDLPQLGDMFGDILADSYCPLLADDLSSSSCPSRTSGDPFFSYREDSNSAHSPSDLDRRLAKSPGDYSLPSLCSPEHDDEPLGLMGLTGDSGGSEIEEDLCLKAPYIPLDEDLPLLIPAVDMLWSESPSPSPPPQSISSRLETSSLAELLRTTVQSVRSNKRTDHDWIKDTGQAKTAKYSSIVSRSDNLLRKAPTGVGPPDRSGVKRTLPAANDMRSKRSRNELPSQLLHQLMEPMQRPGSPPPPPQRSHSVLMNLLDRMPRESKGPLAEVLKQLYNVSIDAPAPREEVGSSRQQTMRLMSSYLLQPGAAIPSLSDLSQQDCEVNAPVDRNTLLQGSDLINALDIDSSLAV